MKLKPGNNTMGEKLRFVYHAPGERINGKMAAILSFHGIGTLQELSWAQVYSFEDVLEWHAPLR
jgi:hypothetical protein